MTHDVREARRLPVGRWLQLSGSDCSAVGRENATDAAALEEHRCAESVSIIWAGTDQGLAGGSSTTSLGDADISRQGRNGARIASLLCDLRQSCCSRCAVGTDARSKAARYFNRYGSMTVPPERLSCAIARSHARATSSSRFCRERSQRGVVQIHVMIEDGLLPPPQL